MTTTNSRSGEKGFTLVELSIVMIIIGLLIGGILKGQELIANARLASSISKIKAIDAAMNTFRDTYAGLPGDILAPNTRIAGCQNRCNTPGNANGLIGAAPALANAAGSENIVAWAQMAAADLLSGIRDTDVGDALAGGSTNPTAEVPGQFYVGYGSALGATGLVYATTTVVPRAGHYLALYNGAGAAQQAVLGAGTVSLIPNQASRIDQKIDDGLPNTGAVLAAGTTGAATVTTTCAAGTTAAVAANIYNGALSGTNCGLYIRVQQ